MEMDLDTITSTPNLDHTHQKGKSELAQKGSLGHRRPPTRAGLKSFVSSVWDHTLEERSISGSSDANHNDTSPNVEISEKITTDSDEYVTSNKSKEPYVVEVNESDLLDEVRSSESVRDEPEGREDLLIHGESEIHKDDDPQDDATRGWKHPPKHAVLVFPMQLLNNNPAPRSNSPVNNHSSTEQIWSSSNRINEGVGEEEIVRAETRNLSSFSKTSTVRISADSTSSSDADDRASEVSSELGKPYSERRTSAPTVVSITLKEPLGARISPTKSVEDIHSATPERSKFGVHSPTVIPFGQFRSAQLVPTKSEKIEGPTQIMIRPFIRNNSFEENIEDLSFQDRDNAFITASNHNRLHRQVQIDEDEETDIRNAGVQVRIATKKISPPSDTNRTYHRDNSSSPERKTEDAARTRKNGTTVSPQGISVTSPPGKNSRATPSRSNTVVFIKPNHPPPPPPNQNGHGAFVSRSLSTREVLNSSKIDFGLPILISPTKDVGGAQGDVSPKLKERCSSVSSLDVCSTKSNDSSKEDSSGGSPPVKPSRRDPNLRQRVQIQTWDRRGKPSASPSPSRSKIRELVMSPSDKSASSGGSRVRPASVIGDGVEAERVIAATRARNQRVERAEDAVEVSSRRSSPTGHRYTPSPNLNKLESKPDWLKKIDLDRRKVIDWENLGSKRPGSSRSDIYLEPSSLQNWPSERSLDKEPSAFREGSSLKTEARTETRSESRERVQVPVRKDTPIPRFSRVPSPARPRTVEGVESSIKEEPEWIRIAERKRNSTINWDEIEALRPVMPEKSNQEVLPDVEDSRNIGIQVKLRKPKHSSDTEGRTKVVEIKSSGAAQTSRDDVATSTSRIPRTASTMVKDSNDAKTPENEAHVIQNILSKVRASRREPSPECDSTSGPAVPEQSVCDSRGRSSNKLETAGKNKQRRSQSTGHSRTPWSDRTEKDIVIEELPRPSSTSKTKGRPASPVPLRSGHRRKDNERPLSMLELGNVNHDSPSRPLSGSSRPPTSGGYSDTPSRSSRNPVEVHRARHAKSREYRRSASYDRSLHVLTSTSGSDQDDEKAADSTSDTQTNKKKVRFLINGNREVKAEAPKSFTMFGMGVPNANGDAFENSKNNNMETENNGMEEDDYQLQAYKIINRIKSMSKSRTPSPDRNGSSKRAPSPDRNGSSKRSSSLQRSSSGENTPPKVTSSKHRKSRNASPESGTRSSKDSLGRSSRKHSSPSGTSHRNSPRRAENSTAYENKRKEPKRSESSRPTTNPSEWTKKSKKSGVDWESLERGPEASSQRPMWAQLKLKRTPFSNQFLSANGEGHADIEETRAGHKEPDYLEDDFRNSAEAHGVPCLSMDAFVEKDNEELSLAAEKKQIFNGDSGYYASVTNGHLSERRTQDSSRNNTHSGKGAVLKKSPRSNGFHKFDKSHLPSLMDSEGYSSMESFSCKAQSRSNSSCSCSNCLQSEKWSTSTDDTNSPVVIHAPKQDSQTPLKSSLRKQRDCVDEDPVEEREDFVVHHYAKDYRKHDWNELDATEPTLPPPPPLNVGLRLSGPCSDTEYGDAAHYLTDDERRPSAARPKRCISMRHLDDIEGKGKRASRRNSLLESRRKLLDILGTIDGKSSKRGPQVKTIRKTIRRILRGSEVTDEEEEIVEEITEEVFGVSDKSSKSINGDGSNNSVKKTATITRTVHQTKDGQKYLTTTMIDGADDIDGGDSRSESPQREPTIVRVTTKRIR